MKFYPCNFARTGLHMLKCSAGEVMIVGRAPEIATVSVDALVVLLHEVGLEGDHAPFLALPQEIPGATPKHKHKPQSIHFD
eukprot:COSAG05_NODE_1534_length_4616_cov_6.656409_5_plen_81_part_00